MRHPKSEGWQWDPKIQALFDKLGLTWKVLPFGCLLTRKQLGSCPGDTMFTGRVFVFQHVCPQEWVIHELAHWLYCRHHRLAGTRLRNYGFDRALEHNFIIPPAYVDEESKVSYLTCGLQKHLGVDYLGTAHVLGLMEGSQRQLVNRMGRVSAPIIRALPQYYVA